MPDKRETAARVVSQEALTGDIRELILETELAEDAQPGQFVNLYCRDSARLLPRPISICDASEGRMRLVYRMVGAGTAELATLKPGEHVRAVGNLGNGYDLQTAAGKRVLIVGGGLGVPPMLFLARRLHELLAAGGNDAPLSLTIVIGYRDRNSVFLAQDFSTYGDLIFASDDGSKGYRGTVLDAIRSEQPAGDVLYACGPMPMLRALAAYVCEPAGESAPGQGENNIKCYVSLEERMACGIGACLGCVTKTAAVDEHSRVHNARICVEGPVFDTESIVW